MQRTGIAANKHPCAPSQRNQFSDGATHRQRSASAGTLCRANQLFFPRTIVENRTQPLRRQFASDFTIPFGRPALRSPSCSWVQNGKLANPAFLQALLNSVLSLAVPRENASRVCRESSSRKRDAHRLQNGFSQREILFDDMPSSRHR